MPGVVHRAAARWPDDEAVVDRDTRLTFAELDTAVREAARAFVASGLQPGDRASVWAPNIHQWIVAALGLYSAGGVLVPLNTRFKGTEAAHVLRTSGARFLFTVTDFLDTDYVALLDEAGARDLVEEIVILEGAVPAGTDELDRLPRARCRCRRQRDRGARGGARRRHDVRHHLHLGHHRRTEGRDAAPRRQRARVRVVGRRRRAAARRPLPPRVPVVPHRGPEVGPGRVAPDRHHAAPPPGVRHAVGDGHRAGGADHDAPRPARDLPDHPQRRPLPVRLLVAAPRGHRCRRRPGRAGGADAGAARARVRGHRLRAHRDHRHREHVPPRRRPRDHRPHVGPADSRASR